VLFAGHSLGEYSALVAAGGLPLGEAVRLVRRRGALMQDAVPEGEGAMAAVLGVILKLPPAKQLMASRQMKSRYLARLLEKMRVDVIEVGFPAASNGDFEAVRAVAEIIKDCTVCGLSRSNDKDIAFFKAARKLKLRNARLAAFGATRRAHVPAAKDPQVRTLLDSGVPVLTIVGKSWLFHVREVLRTHEHVTGSPVAARLLQRWNTEVRRFEKIAVQDLPPGSWSRVGAAEFAVILESALEEASGNYAAAREAMQASLKRIVALKPSSALEMREAAQNAPTIAGAVADGTPAYIKVSRTQPRTSSTYELYAHIRPPIAAAQLEDESGPFGNDQWTSPTWPTQIYSANPVSGGGYIQGQMDYAGDTDCFKFLVNKGDLMDWFGAGNPQQIGRAHV
jgi:hypothetical protein